MLDTFPTMDSPFIRGPLESPYLRAQEAKFGQNSSFSLGPAMNDNSGGFDASPSADSPQGTAELTAFVQNLLQQMQTRFQSMSDAIIVKIDGMASRIDELERAVDEVLREVTGDDQLPTPSSPMLRGVGAPGSPDRRKYSMGSAPGQSPYYPAGGQGSGSYYPSSPGSIARYPSTGALMSPKTTALTGGYQSGSGAFAGASPDPRRHSTTGAMPAASPRSLTLQGSFGTNSPGVRRALSSSLGASESQENRQRSDN